jgi:hypothetical protein
MVLLAAVTAAGLSLQDTLSTALRTYLLYNTAPGRLLMRLPPTWWLLGLQHKHLAQHANSPESRKEIPSFIKVGDWATTLLAGNDVLYSRYFPAVATILSDRPLLSGAWPTCVHIQPWSAGV